MPKRVQPKPCTWTYIDDPDCDYYATACEHSFSFEECTPKEIGAKFCIYCGGKMIVKKERHAD